jgi:hypothetical protein
MGHHAAGGDVADQAELASALDDHGADAQDLDVPLGGAALRRLRNVVRKGEACLHDAILKVHLSVPCARALLFD